MLLGNFYTISSVQKENNSINAMLELNTTHRIFEGHFPGQPVVPGACLLQMVKEIMQTVTPNNIRLIKAHQLKFISPINPSANNDLRFALTYNISANDEITVSATLLNNTVACFKFSGVFQSGK